MIKSFRCKYTEKLFSGEAPKQFRAFKAQAERKLQLLDSAETLEFLRSPPGNRLEALHRDREGQYSIRINDQWRICFRFENGDALDVEIVDYH
jgi:toxin HigB-1